MTLKSAETEKQSLQRANKDLKFDDWQFKLITALRNVYEQQND